MPRKTRDRAAIFLRGYIPRLNFAEICAALPNGLEIVAL